MGDLVTQDMEKAEVLNDFLPQSSPATDCSSHITQVADEKGKD